MDKTKPKRIWMVEFGSAHKVMLETVEINKNKIMMTARKKLSDDNRYNFEARQASGGRIVKCYPMR